MPTERVSSGRPKQGPPAHANKQAFKHNRASKKTAAILGMPISPLLCPPCHAQIEWRKRFRKYKPLTVPKKCCHCGRKDGVRAAYHVICDACSVPAKKCPKCLVVRTPESDSRPVPLPSSSSPFPSSSEGEEGESESASDFDGSE